MNKKGENKNLEEAKEYIECCETKEDLYDLIDEIEGKNKELYEEILQSADYLEFEGRMIKGEKTADEIKEKIKYYKKEFEKTLNTGSQIEKPKQQASGKKLKKLENELKNKEGILRVFKGKATPEQIEANLERYQNAVGTVKEEINKIKESAKQEVAKITEIVTGNNDAIPEDKAAAENSQKAAEKSIESGAQAAEQVVADFVSSLKEIADEQDRLDPIISEAVMFQLGKKTKGMKIKKEETERFGKEIKTEIEIANKKIKERKNKQAVSADMPVLKIEGEIKLEELRKEETEKNKKLETGMGSMYMAQQDGKDLKTVQKEIRDIIKLEELRKEEAEIRSRLAGLGAVHIMRVNKELEAVQKQIKDIEEGVEIKTEGGSKSGGKKEDIKKKIIGLDKAVLTGLIKFNFKKEDLENIASFVGLDKPQQLFALAGLNQAILEKAKIDALEAYNIKSKEGGWMKKAFTGLTKNYQISNLEKELAQKITKGEGGYKQYLEMSLGALSEIAGNIPDMVEKEGKIEIAYIKKDDFGNLPPRADSKLDELNQVFNQFSKIPQEWSLDTASKDEKKQYRTMAKKYEKAKKEVLQLKSIANNETEAMAYLSGVEGQAKLHQLFNTHPDAEKALAEMSSNKNWMKALKNVVVERGGYAAAGYALRSYTMATVGMVGLPIAAAVMGGWMGRKRAQSSLRERELLNKHGREGEQSKEDRNIVKAAGLISKIKLLENKIKNESDDGKRAKLTDSLKVRIQYTEDKLTKGLVDYGANEARIENKYDLFQKLNYAKNLEMVSGGYGERGNRLLSRLNEYLSDKEGKINKARSKYLRDKMINGAVFGAAFAVGGYAIRHFAGEWYSGNNNNTDVVNEAPVSNENILGKIEPVEPAIEPVAAVPTIKIGDVVMEAPSNPLAIGKRGPEGAVIDYLESKGMESEKAGSKAHKMFLEWAGSDEGKEFLSAKLPDGDINNPEYVDEAMRHISEGEVEITPEGKMRIVEAKFLDFNEEEGELVPEVEKLYPIDKYKRGTAMYLLEKLKLGNSANLLEGIGNETFSELNNKTTPIIEGIIKELKENGLNDEKMAERMEAISTAATQRAGIGLNEIRGAILHEMQEAMASPVGKLEGIFNFTKLAEKHNSGWAVDAWVDDRIKDIGGYEKIINMKTSDLFTDNSRFAGETFKRVGLFLKDLSGNTALETSKLSVKEVIESISSTKINEISEGIIKELIIKKKI